MDLREADLVEEMEGMVRCGVSYRNVVHRFDDGAALLRFDPEGYGEIWRDGELLLRLRPELMAIFEAGLLRDELRRGPEVSWQVVT